MGEKETKHGTCSPVNADNIFSDKETHLESPGTAAEILDEFPFFSLCEHVS